ncbi:MAG: sigma-70 family RNA polymerase sigma factor [Gemmatimonadaceae bacterium]
MGDVTRLLERWRDGDVQALEELTPLVYGELRQLARHYMRSERGDHTLQPTALVHEAYVRLTNVRTARFEDRVHFYGAAAQVMRRNLVDHARQRGAAKRGRGVVRVDLDDAVAIGIDQRLDLVPLNDALDRLAGVAASAAKVVELRYFGGLSIDETAAFLDIAPATVKRHWTLGPSGWV